MGALYNEIEPYAANWMENLIHEGHIAPGAVERRSIRELAPDDVRAATQFHAFAGLGGWSHALRLAGWPDDLPAWTGSCPCQPFSAAGRKRGTDDDRHLWPAWFGLIRECRPGVIFGEQVASPDALRWLDAVCADLEGEGYACAAFDLGAASVGAPHIRQRLYLVALADRERRQGIGLRLLAGQPRSASLETWRGGKARDGAMVHADLVGRERTEAADDETRHGRPGERSAAAVALANAEHDDGPGRIRATHGRETIEPDRYGVTGFWSPADWTPCRDGKARPVEPGTFPLAHGATARVGRLRAYGNAIVAPLAAEVIRATMDHLIDEARAQEGAA